MHIGRVSIKTNLKHSQKGFTKTLSLPLSYEAEEINLSAIISPD